MTRRYQETQVLLPQIQQMLEDGMTQREVSEALGLKGDRPVHALLKREQKKAYFQYTSQAYFKLTQSYGITPSMSRKGNPYDNAIAENFFSILKTECTYRQKSRSFQEANEMINSYIHFYNHECIQTKDEWCHFT